MSYQPPYKLTDEILSLVAQISEAVGRFAELSLDETALRLRRTNRIRTVTGSLAIEGNTLSETQISAILEGKQVVAPAKEIVEARNALDSYAQIENLDPLEEDDLLAAHQMMMAGLIETVGSYRSDGVGVMSGETVIHMAPPASQVPRLMSDLFAWIKKTDIHPLLSSSIFHYELEFIHPFADGNGRLGRLWQTLLLYRWRPLMADLPVESVVYRYQSAYYQALSQSTKKSDCAPFIHFMLERVKEALEIRNTPKVSPYVTPEVKRLLEVLEGEMSAQQLMLAMGLKDEKHFRQQYRQPALSAGMIEMTQPDKPRSSKQQYRLTDLGRLWKISRQDKTDEQVHSGGNGQ